MIYPPIAKNSVHGLLPSDNGVPKINSVVESTAKNVTICYLCATSATNQNCAHGDLLSITPNARCECKTSGSLSWTNEDQKINNKARN